MYKVSYQARYLQQFHVMRIIAHKLWYLLYGYTVVYLSPAHLPLLEPGPALIIASLGSVTSAEGSADTYFRELNSSMWSRTTCQRWTMCWLG